MYPLGGLPPVAYIIPPIPGRCNGPHGAVPGAVDGAALYIAGLVLYIHIITGVTILQINKTAAGIHLRPLIGGICPGIGSIFQLSISAVVEIGIDLPPVEYLIIGCPGRRAGIGIIPGAVEVPPILVPAEIRGLVGAVVENEIRGRDIDKSIGIPAITRSGLH